MNFRGFVNGLLHKAVGTFVENRRFGHQTAAAAQVVLRPLCPGQRPFMLITPLIGSQQEKFYRRLFHKAGVYPLKPVVHPPDNLVVQLVPGSLVTQSQGRHDNFLGHIDTVIG